MRSDKISNLVCVNSSDSLNTTLTYLNNYVKNLENSYIYYAKQNGA